MADPAEATVRNKSRRYSFEVLPLGQLSGRRAAAIGGFRKHRGTGHYHTKTRSARSFLSGSACPKMNDRTLFRQGYNGDQEVNFSRVLPSLAPRLFSARSVAHRPYSKKTADYVPAPGQIAFAKRLLTRLLIFYEVTSQHHDTVRGLDERSIIFGSR